MAKSTIKSLIQRLFSFINFSSSENDLCFPSQSFSFVSLLQLKHFFSDKRVLDQANEYDRIGWRVNRAIVLLHSHYMANCAKFNLQIRNTSQTFWPAMMFI